MSGINNLTMPLSSTVTLRPSTCTSAPGYILSLKGFYIFTRIFPYVLGLRRRPMLTIAFNGRIVSTFIQLSQLTLIRTGSSKNLPGMFANIAGVPISGMVSDFVSLSRTIDTKASFIAGRLSLCVDASVSCTFRLNG